MNTILKRDIAAHAAALERRDYTAEELTRAHLAQIEACEGTVGAFLTVDAKGAIEAARASDARRRAGTPLSALDGIPFSLKDNICVAGMRMTCASRMLEDYIAPYDATVTTLLRRAGAVLVGKNNMDEFAMGSSTEYSALGVTRNPADPDFVPGGSSGGSAAAVAASEVSFSLGTDTGGSVRQPAAFCGVCGFKPTWGAISRYGVAAMASSLDCVGILTRTVRDCATVFSSLAVSDAMDATACRHPQQDVMKALDRPLGKLRIAVIDSLGEESMDASVWKAFCAAVELFAGRGDTVETVRLPHPAQALATYNVISCAEAASNLARYDGVHFGRRCAAFDSLSALYDNTRGECFGPEVKRRILFGTDMLSEGQREVFYVRAQRMRELVTQEMTALSREYDLLLTPTTTTPAFRFGSQPTPKELYYADLCTVYANLSGFPAMSIPFGRSSEGLPIGIQLTARPWEEGLLLRAARLLEEGNI